MRTKGEAAKAAAEAIASYRRQAEEMEHESSAIRADLEAVKAEYSQVMTELTRQLLPDAAPARLEAVARGTGAGLLPQERVKLEQQRQMWAARLREIDSDPDFTARQELLHPHHGELGGKLQEARDQHRELQNTLAIFDHRTFRWLMSRQGEENAAGLKGFWRKVTFADYREERARQSLVGELGYADWNALMADYQRCTSAIGPSEARLHQLEARRSRLQELVIEHEDLDAWVNRFEEKVTQHIRDQLAAHLSRTDPAQLHGNLGPALRPLAARLHGLLQKIGYLDQMQNYLHREIVDRHNRVQKMDRVRMLWERKPWDRVHGDKTKWLVTVPHLKADSSSKRVRWVRSMRKNVVDYDDWDDYDLYLTEVDDFLPYDAFAYGAEERMPYEGFTREVIGDLDEHRRETGLEKADYSAYKEAEKAGPVDDLTDEGEGGGGVDTGAASGAAVAVTAAATVAGVVAVSEAAGATDFLDLS